MINIAEMKKEIVPSQDLFANPKNLCFPNFLPKTAAIKSEIIKIVKAIIAINFGKIKIVKTEEIKNQEAPFNKILFVLISCSRRKIPNIRK